MTEQEYYVICDGCGVVISESVALIEKNKCYCKSCSERK